MIGTGATGIIFRRELQAYVRSPMGYIVAAVVLLLDGIFFYATALGPEAGERLSGTVLAGFFFNASGLTAVAAVALSIRLIAEERQTGTQLLLDTSPVRDWEIVLGKFLSALAFLTAITLATLYIPLLILVNGKIAIAHILIGYLGSSCSAPRSSRSVSSPRRSPVTSSWRRRSRRSLPASCSFSGSCRRSWARPSRGCLRRWPFTAATSPGF